MPIKNDPTAVTAHIHQALQDSILTQNEADQLLNEVKQDGVTEEEVHALVDSLKQALSGSADVSLDVSTAERKETINRFLGRVNEEKALPLGGANGSAATGSVNWLNLMTMQSDAVAQPLDKDSFSGVEVSVDGEGQIFAGDGLVDLAADKPSDTAIDALWALNKPGQLENLTDQELDGLTQDMLGVIETHQGVPNDQPGKYRKIVASTAAAGMLSETAET